MLAVVHVCSMRILYVVFAHWITIRFVLAENFHLLGLQANSLQHLLVLYLVKLTRIELLWLALVFGLLLLIDLYLRLLVHKVLMLVARQLELLLVELVWTGHVATILQQLPRQRLLWVIHTLLVPRSASFLDNFHLVSHPLFVFFTELVIVVQQIVRLQRLMLLHVLFLHY